MTADELTIELTRLAEGFEVKITKPRFDAYWQGFGYCRYADFHDAITECLREPRYPTNEQLLVRLDKAAQARHQREKHHREVEAKRDMARLEQDAMTCPERQTFVEWLHGMRQASTGLSKPPLVYRCQRHDCYGNENGCRQGSACGTGAKWQEAAMVGR